MTDLIAEVWKELNSIKVSRLEYPAVTSFDEGTFRFIGAVIRVTAAKHVAEFGGGYAALLAARELEKTDGVLWLFESDGAALEKIKSEINLSAEHCRVVPSQMRRTCKFFGTRLLHAYSSVSPCDMPSGIDVAVICREQKDKKRIEGMLRDIFGFLSERGVIIIAGTGGDEQLRRGIERTVGGSGEVVWLDGFGHGMAVIEKKKDKLPRPGLLEDIGATFRSLFSLIRK